MYLWVMNWLSFSAHFLRKIWAVKLFNFKSISQTSRVSNSLSPLQLLTKRATGCCARALTIENVNNFYFGRPLFCILDSIILWFSKGNGFNMTHKLLYFTSTINTQDYRIRRQSPEEFRIPHQKLRSLSQTMGSARNSVVKENQREGQQLRRIFKTTLK